MASPLKKKGKETNLVWNRGALRRTWKAGN